MAIKPGSNSPGITVETPLLAAGDRVPGPHGPLDVVIGAVEDRPLFFLGLAVFLGQLVG